ncbi:MAG: hypothetical protein ACR2LY_01760 [Thermoleophilaceae bacterium]
MLKRAQKIIMGLAALAVLGLGGAALAGAAQGPDLAPSKAASVEEREGPESAGGQKEGPEGAGDESESNDNVSPADARRAEAAALAEIGSGKVNEVSAETSDADEPGERPETGDSPDPPYESRIAYEVEITKADGSVVDVALDRSFNVLGTEAAEQDEGEHQDGQNEAAK